jgi:uncharacterized membrane protein YdbT with pleckstrin-like domain
MPYSRTLYKARPSWWNYLWLFAFGWLIFPIFIAIWQRYSELLRITNRQVILETGVLNKDVREIFISDIRAVDVEQRFYQRLLGYGTIKFASAGTDRYELAAKGIARPQYARDLVNSLRRKQRATRD